MSRRTVQTMLANVQRAIPIGIPLGEIHKVLDTVYKDTHAAYDWPWSYGETNVLVQAAYTTGTVSVTDGTAAVTGAGTTWDTGWNGMRIRFGVNNNVDYIVTSIGGVGTLTLAQTVNLGASLTGSSYTLYKDTYRMPTDFEVGTDIILAQPNLRYRIKHVPRMHLETQALSLKQVFTSVTMYYSDGGFDDTAPGYNTIKFIPPPSTTGEYRMVYRKRPPDLTTLAQVTWLPQGLDECVELLAQARLKEQYSIPGWESDRDRAVGKLRIMRRQVATNAAMENQARGTSGVPDSSISQWGLSISPYAP